MGKRMLLWALAGLATNQAALAGPLLPPDSIGVERKGNKNLVLYQVEKGETLFGITRKYRTTVGEVQRLNPELKAGIKLGQIIRVPALSNTAPAATAAKPAANAELQKVHIVTSGQTLFAIAKQYKVSVANLQSWNNLSGAGLVEGQQLIVSNPEANGAPTIAAAPKPAPEARPAPKPEPKAETAPQPKAEPKPEPKMAPQQALDATAAVETRPTVIRHVVKAGETLYAIARTYNAQPEQIKRDNNLADGSLKVGQPLEIRRGAPLDEQAVAKPAAPIAEKVAEAKGESTDSAAAEARGMATPATFERVVEHGVAELVDNDAGSRNYFCLHRTAPIGKIIQVVNEMNGARVFVRVIGKLPETGNNDKVAIKISRKAFEALAPADKRFPVEITYPNQ